MVFRRREEVKDRLPTVEQVLERTTDLAQKQAKRLEDVNHRIDSNDLKVIKSAPAVLFMSVCEEQIQSPENVIKLAAAHDGDPRHQ